MKELEIAISFSEWWLCASIEELNIFTQAKTWDDLLKNIQEVLELYFEDKPRTLKDISSRFYFAFTPSYASKISSIN